MDFTKNDSLFTYIKSIDTLDLFSNYRHKKTPKLNKYAQDYLAKLEKEKINNEYNINNSNNNTYNLNLDIINDNFSLVKDTSNDIINKEHVLNNKIYKIINKNQSEESNIKTENYLSIEQLKKNFENKNNLKTNIIEKVNTITIPHNKMDDNKYIHENKVESKEKLKKFLKKIVIKDRNNKLNSPLFFDFSCNKNIKYKKKLKCRNNNITYKNNLYFSSSSNILKNAKNKSFFSKQKENNNIRTNKVNKNYGPSKLIANILTTYRNKKNHNKDIKKRLISSFLTEDSNGTSVRSKTNTHSNINKTYSITLNDYWKEKEIKKNIRISKN